MEREQARALTLEVIAKLTVQSVAKIPSLADAFVNSMKGKTAIITGGVTGLGYNVTNRLAEAGANVVIASRSPQKGEKAEKEFQERGYEVSFCPTDVTDVEACRRAVAFAEEKYGQVDILVANAATWSMYSYLDMPENEFDTVMDCDLKGEYFMGQATTRSMVKNKVPGKIVFVSSSGCVPPCPTLCSEKLWTSTAAYSRTTRNSLGVIPWKAANLATGSMNEDKLRAYVAAQSIEIPDTLVENEVSAIICELQCRRRYGRYECLAGNGSLTYSPTELDEKNETIRAEAVQAVKTRLVIQRVIEEQQIEVAPQELEAGAHAIAERKQMPFEMVKRFLGTNFGMLSRDLKERKAINYICNQV